MTIRKFRYPLIPLLLVILVYACSDQSEVPSISTDIDELKKFINLDHYQPKEVKWSYEKMGIQSDNRVPGPDDYKLEAILVFDSATVKDLKNNYSLLSVSIPMLHKDRFRFIWLDKKNLNELNNNNSMSIYHPSFFKKGVLMHGGFIIINETTILLSLNTM